MYIWINQIEREGVKYKEKESNNTKKNAQRESTKRQRCPGVEFGRNQSSHHYSTLQCGLAWVGSAEGWKLLDWAFSPVWLADFNHSILDAWDYWFVPWLGVLEASLGWSYSFESYWEINVLILESFLSLIRLFFLCCQDDKLWGWGDKKIIVICLKEWTGIA